MRTPRSTAALVCLLLGCQDLTGTPDLPAGTSSIENFNTPAGALGFYAGITAEFGFRMADLAFTVGLVTDELQTGALLGNTNPLIKGSSGYPLIDSRVDLTSDRGHYVTLQYMRHQTRYGIEIFKKYAPMLSSALRGELYVIQGYAVLGLADLYCSGVPLSTIDFEQDYTYRAGSTTTALYEHAVALFDTALTLSADSVRVMHWARIGKGRALLALGRYADAGAAVENVPRIFEIQSLVRWQLGTSAGVIRHITVSDREGGVGEAFRTANDARIDTVFTVANPYGARLYWVRKYSLTANSPFIIADGIEAELIRAEAALHANQVAEWLATLNRLRTRVPGLADLTDPGTREDRIDLLFRERAFWLYLRGLRQGDLRRLIREYGRPLETVYPSGTYHSVGDGVPAEYSPSVVFQIPDDERVNPLFQGCLNHDA